MTSLEWTTWTVDVEALGRAVDVPVVAMPGGGDRSPTMRELLNALDSEEDRRTVEEAHAEWVRSLREDRTPTPERPDHVCVGTCDMECCPGCGDGCGKCEGYRICWSGEVGCVMPELHDGPCVPGGTPWKTRADVEAAAEPLRLAGIAYELVQHEHNGERWRLERDSDRQVPDSGRWVRRWTEHNVTELLEWLTGHGCDLRELRDDNGSLMEITIRPAGKSWPEFAYPGSVIHVRPEYGEVSTIDPPRPPSKQGPRTPELEWPMR